MIKTSWWVDFTVNSTRYRKRSPENTKAGAQAYEATLRQKLARGDSIELGALRSKDLTFAEFAVKWFDDYVRPNNKYSEQLSKKYILSSSLLPFFGRKPVGQIKGHDIERYKAQQVQQGYTNKTITNRLTVLNKCFLTAYEWLELEEAPPKIKWPKRALPEIDYLSPEECELLLSQANGLVRELVLTALRTGMRQGELRGLQWSSLDWLTRTVAVRHSYDDRGKTLVAPKNNRTRHIPLDIDVYTMLYRRKKDTGYVFRGSEGRPFTNYRMHYAIRKLCKKAGFRTIGWHTLRHTFASHLAMRGVPLPAIKELMGHSTITTTMRYAHVAPSTLRTAIEMLNPKTMMATDSGQPVGNRWQEIQRSVARQNNSAAEYA
ncbi:integrase [Bradyrhizobium sp. USDA 4501]